MNKQTSPQRRRGPQEPWEKLDRLRGPAALQEKPAGAFTTREYGEHYGLGHSASQEQLNRFVQAGAVEFLGKMGKHRENLYKLAG